MAPSSRSRRFPFFEAPKKQGPEKNGEEAGRLRVGEAEKRFRIDANELDQKPRGSGEDQVVAENLAARFRPAQRFCSHAPEKRGNRHPDDEFVDRRGMRSEEHTSELQSPCNLVCRLLLEKKKNTKIQNSIS